MVKVAAIIVLVGVALSSVSAQNKPTIKLPSVPEPPRTRFQPEVNLSGNNLKNFGGRVGGRVEHDFIRNGRHTLTGSAGAGQAFQRFEGHTYKAKPDYNVGVGYRFRF